MAEIHRFPGNTILQEPMDNFLTKVPEWNLDRGIVIGLDKEGEFCFGGNFSDTAEIVLLLEIAKHKMVTDDF